MKTHRSLLKLAILAALLPAVAAHASLVGYQGRVVVNGTNYNGTGYFKFAVVNNGESISRWSNDGSSSAGSEPTSSVPLTVTKGLFSVALGDTDLSGMTSNLFPTVLASFDAYLKIWFSPSNSGFVALSPNLHLVAGSAYAVYAEEAYAVRPGGITSSQIGEGQVGTVNILDGDVTTDDLNDGAVSTPKLGDASVTTAKLDDYAVISSKLAPGAVSALGSPDGSLTNVLVTDNSGNVGIGTDTNPPAATLDVNGTVKASVFSGSGAALSGLNAASVTGTLSDAQLSTNVALKNGGASFNGSVSATKFIGGSSSSAGGQFASVGGGLRNTASGDGAFIGGGADNKASGLEAVIGGGETNIASGDYSAVAGGFGNRASDYFAFVAGGESNTANGEYSFAAGRRAKAGDNGAFVWADDTEADFLSTSSNQFLIRAAGGVGIGTTNPSAQLHVNGSLRVEGVTAMASNTTISGRLDVDSGAGQYVLNLTSSNNAGTWFTLGNDRTNGETWSIVSTAPGNGEGAGNLLILPGSSGPRMVFNTNGNLGVGLGISTIPTNKLHVAGTIYATSNVVAGAFEIIAQSTLSPTNGATLTPSTGYVMLTPSASVTLSVATAISSGAIPGQSLLLQGNNANSVSITNGANTRLAATLVTLSSNDTLRLIWSGAAWIATGSQNNL